jgi:hypothetical protein
VVAAIDSRPDVGGRVAVGATLGGDLHLVAAGFDVAGDGAHQVPNAELARRRRVEQVLALGALHRPLVGERGVVETVVGEHLEHVAGEAVDVEIDPEVHVVDVRHVRVDRMELAAHPEVDVDPAVAVDPTGARTGTSRTGTWR